MDSINYTFILSLLVIALGYLFKVTGILSEEHGKSLSRVLINVTLPALILITISGIDLDFRLILMPLICILFSALVSLAGVFLFKKEAPEQRGVAALTTAGFNVGLFAYPLIEGVFGIPGLRHVAMFDFGNAFILFGLIYLLGYKYSEKTSHKKLTAGGSVKMLFRSVPFMSYLLAITINLAGFKIPVPVTDFLSIISRANMPMALLVLGLTLNFRFDKQHWKLIIKVLLLRYLAGLTAGLLFFLVLPFSVMYKTILLFGLILPVGLASIPFSVEFNYDPKIPGTIANIMIVISFLFMWLFLWLLGGPLGLHSFYTG